MRPKEAAARCAMLITQPIEMKGQMSLARKRLKVTNWPTEIPPVTSSRPPYPSTIAEASPMTPWSRGWKAAFQRIRRRLPSR